MNHFGARIGIVSIALSLATVGVVGATLTFHGQQFGAVMQNASQQHENGGTCPMNASEHIAWWSSIFSAVTCAGIALPTAPLFATVVFAALFLIIGVRPRAFATATAPPSPIQEFIAAGRLQPKHCA